MSISKMHGVGFIMLACSGCSEDPLALPPRTCDPSAAAGIEIAQGDAYGLAPYALGYPAYAAEGCTLLYVAPSKDGETGGDLRLRNLATGAEIVIAEAATSPRRPVLAGAWMAWEEEPQGRTLIHLHNYENGITKTIEGTYHHASEPRISRTGLVFTVWWGSSTAADTDVALYDFSTQSVTMIGQGPGQQRFADISETHVAWSDFSEDPDGRFDDHALDVADIVIMNRQTQTMATRKRAGKQAFPMLGAEGKLAFLDWNLVHPEPKLIAYDLRLADIDAPLTDSVLVQSIRTSAPYIRPTARGEFLEWVGLVDAVRSAIFRLKTDGITEPTMLTVDNNRVPLHRFAPIATDTMTFVGAQDSLGDVMLEAYAR